MFSNVFSKALQGLNIILTIIGILICIGLIIYGSIEKWTVIIVCASILLANHIKSMLDYTVFYGKMRKIANNLRESVQFLEKQNKKLADNINDLSKIKDDMKSETNRLARIVRDGENQINELSSIKGELEKNNITLTKTNAKLVILKDQFHLENQALTENIQKSQEELQLI